MLNRSHLSAARAWFSLSQTELGDAIGITKQTVITLEKDPESVSRDVLEKALDYYSRRGLSVSESGLKVMDEPVRLLRGDDWYIHLLEDIAWSGAKEALFEFVDDSVSPPAVVEKLRGLRSSGVAMRFMARDGFIAGQLDEYRILPASAFENIVNVTYADRYAIGRGDKNSCRIIRDADLAAATAKRFNLLWSYLPQPKTTTAPDDARF